MSSSLIKSLMMNWPNGTASHKRYPKSERDQDLIANSAYL